jgi:hypothetical protein
MATAPLIGNIGEYDPENKDFDNYSKRLTVRFKVNKIKDKDNVSVFLALVGAKAFQNLVSMTVPHDPASKSLAELTKLLSNFHKAPRNQIAERMGIRERKQKDGETISECIVDLKRLSIRCGYGDTLSENLRDTFTQCWFKRFQHKEKVVVD